MESGHNARIQTVVKVKWTEWFCINRDSIRGVQRAPTDTSSSQSIEKKVRTRLRVALMDIPWLRHLRYELSHV